MNKKITIIAACFLAVLVLSGIYFVTSRKNDRKNIPGAGQRQNPPAEMSSTCQGKNEGDSCEASMPQRDNSGGSNKISGTCKKAPSGSQLFCMLQGGPGGPGRQSGPGGQVPNTN